MKSYFILAVFILTSMTLSAQKSKSMTPFELDNTVTADYAQIIEYYKQLAKNNEQVHITEAGQSDIGKPIHLVIISKFGIKNVSEINRDQFSVLLINNGIHPGEPCGVDASMMLVRDLASDNPKANLLDNTVIILIPMYNISGALNRTSTSRANQLGPQKYGFRGNIRHLDLNRDFVKTVSKNAQTFNHIFNEWKPDLFVDNHTSNGADYQYTMTLIPTQKDKLEPSLKELLVEDMLPYFYKGMKEKSWDMTPYVYARSTPDGGIMGFLDLPRYSSGYAALHHCIGFMPETHMLKPYKDRVVSTYDFMVTVLEYLEIEGQKLRSAKKEAINHTISSQTVNLNWELDKDNKDQFLFKGYEAKYKKSAVHGHDRLYYDRNSPYEKNIDFWNSYKPTTSVTKPKSYIVPQAYSDIIEKLKNNGVVMSQLENETVLDVNMYYIDSYETSKEPYEGKYLHSDITLVKKQRNQQYYKGDYIINLGQETDRYIVETLEPNAPDSFFAWGYFDAILMQKEYFSSYVFEDLAEQILANNPKLKQSLEQKRIENEEFKNNAYAQLMYIYQHSEFYEDTHKLYPVGRVRE